MLKLVLVFFAKFDDSSGVLNTQGNTYIQMSNAVFCNKKKLQLASQKKNVIYFQN